MHEKPKIVLDTNVVISAALSQGSPNKIIQLLLTQKIQIFTSNEILLEIASVFNRQKIRKRLSKTQITTMLEIYIAFSTIVTPKTKVTVVDDPDDNKFIECALESSAKLIISGDPHLLAVKQYKKINIITPREFLEI